MNWRSERSLLTNPGESQKSREDSDGDDDNDDATVSRGNSPVKDAGDGEDKTQREGDGQEERENNDNGEEDQDSDNKVLELDPSSAYPRFAEQTLEVEC